MSSPTQPDPSQPILVRVRFRGVLDASWFAGLKVVALTTAGRGRAAETTLVAEAVDEAALMGVLNLLYQLRHPLISVTCAGGGAAPA